MSPTGDRADRARAAGIAGNFGPLCVRSSGTTLALAHGMTFKSALPFLAAVLLSSLAGCANDAPKPEREGSTESKMSRKGNGFYEIPHGSGYVMSASFPSLYRFGEEVERSCGGTFSIDVAVTFGEVTETTMTVESLTVTFHAGSAEEMALGTVDLYGRETHRIGSDYLPQRDGSSVRYEVQRVFTVDSRTSLVVDVYSQAGLPGLDGKDAAESVTCSQLARIAFYPTGVMHGGNPPDPVYGPPIPEEQPAPEPLAEPIPPQPEPANSGDACADGILSPELMFCGQSPGTEQQLFRCEAGSWVESPCTEGCMVNPDRYGQDYCY